MKKFFYKIVVVAERGGYKKHLRFLPIFCHVDEKQFDDFCIKIYWARKKELVFDIMFMHSFLKGIFK